MLERPLLVESAFPLYPNKQAADNSHRFFFNTKPIQGHGFDNETNGEIYTGLHPGTIIDERLCTTFFNFDCFYISRYLHLMIISEVTTNKNPKNRDN